MFGRNCLRIIVIRGQTMYHGCASCKMKNKILKGEYMETAELQ